MSTYIIVDSEEEESRFATYPKEGVMKMDDKEETTLTIIMRKPWNMDTNEEEQTMPRATLMSKIGSKDVNTTPSEINSM